MAKIGAIADTPTGRRCDAGGMKKGVEGHPKGCVCAECCARRGGTTLTATRPPRPTVEMVCPHCQTSGHVMTERVKVKQRISGGKATGAVLTGGFSLRAWVWGHG